MGTPTPQNKAHSLELMFINKTYLFILLRLEKMGGKIQKYMHCIYPVAGSIAYTLLLVMTKIVFSSASHFENEECIEKNLDRLPPFEKSCIHP